MEYVMGEIYHFNLTIEGTTYGIECAYEGKGETMNGKSIAYFTRIKGDGQRGHTFKWSYEQAVAHTPELWATPKEVFNAAS